MRLFWIVTLAGAAMGQTAQLESLHQYNKKQIVAAAEMIEEADYNYRPSPEVRTVRELLAHIADAQNLFREMAEGRPDPGSPIEKADLPKMALLKELRAALARGDDLFAKSGELYGKTQALSVYHSGQHYGNLVTYMRLKGLVPPGASRAAKKEPEMTTYHMGFLVRGAKWTAERTEESGRIQAEHLAHMKKNHEAGKLVMAGPFLDGGNIRGIVVYKVASIEEARALTEADPAVQAGRLAVEMHPWMVQKGILP